MRIKKLELVGFKSFKDKTVINFDQGITGIVGPNGCGKSNIVDALVWVMGEMSAKHLRGSSMEDVIFAGAENYAPMGMAEVSLTLENSGGAFPAKYSRMTEIMITRRLHRSGESEYLVNRESARLRDIQEIFMDTGAGSKGFSIIEQGAIGKIITAKPEDRRTLIEEAAGITKFKARKRESQRKLESTDQNLVRLQDILGEQKRQLESLERQAARAERFRDLRNQMQQKEILMASKQYWALREDFDKLETQIQELSDLEIQQSSQQSQNESGLQELRLNVVEQEKLVENRQQRQQQLALSVQQLEHQIRELQFEMEQAKRSREMTGTLLGQFEARQGALKADLELTESRLSQAQADLEGVSTSYGSKSQEFQAIQERISSLDDILTRKRREMLTLAQTESHLDARVESLTGQSETQQEQLENAHKVVEDLKNQKTEFEKRRNRVFSELEGERQLQLSIMKDVENFEANISMVREQLEARTGETNQLKDELNQVTSRLYGLENLQASFEGFEDGVKNVMLWQRTRTERQVSVDGSVTETQTMDPLRPVAEVVEVPEQFELAMEGALGTKLQLLLAQRAETAIEAVDYLKEKKSGRSGFVAADVGSAQAPIATAAQMKQAGGVVAILTDVVQSPIEFQTQVQNLMGQIAVVDSIRTALRLRPEFPGWTFVTTEGDALSADGVLTGGTAESAQSGVIQRRREIRDLSLKREELAGKLALAQTSLKKLDEKHKTLSEELENAKKKNNEQEHKLISLQKDLDRAEMELRNAGHAVERSEKDRERVESELAKLQANLQQLQESLDDTREKRGELEVEVGEADLELKSSREGIDDLQRTVTDLQVRKAQKTQELQGLQSQWEMLSKSLAEVTEQLQKMSSEKEKSGEVLSTHQVLIETKKVELERHIREVSEANTLLAQARNQLEETMATVRQLEAQISSAMGGLSQIRDQRSQAQIKVEQIRNKEQLILSQIQERYMIHLPDVAEPFRDQVVDVGALEVEVGDLKSRLAKIGDVNLSAITEYEELSGRYKFLSQQYDDLIESRDQLRRVIERINKICSRRFRETFEKVNERFTKVFPVLFGGGEAQLILVENPEENDQGIDIVARPPGKKLQNVSLLSGGEKALTAVSLIFSIFLVKPSPFCLLDEVDAPLDDANVSRFNDLVKEMAKRSQIIVVTHNKHTMKVNNILYGVTMEEKGVSKMVSVNLAEAV